MSKFIYRFHLAASLLIVTCSAGAQPTISGATCVVPGTTYQYLIGGVWDSASTMRICVTGGVVVPFNTTCIPSGAPVSSILVVWNMGDSSAAINVASSKGSTNLAITATTPLQAGIIRDSSKMVSVGFNVGFSVIYCGADSGGSCRPVYVHQWQQSRDNVHWTDIPLATGNNLGPILGQHQTIFFRRKTTETVSGTVAYSGAAVMMVGAPPPGTTAAAMN